MFFNNIHASGFRMPHIVGRKDAVLQDIYFSNCTFEQLNFEAVNDGKNMDRFSIMTHCHIA
jgi:hypothetical protein